MAKRKGRKLPTILDENEIKSILKVFNKRYLSSFTNYLILRLMAETGMRISEVINLKLEFVDLNTGKIFIKEGKGKKDRIVFINNGLLNSFITYLERTEKSNTGLVFTTRTEGKIDQNNVNRMIETYRIKAGIEKHISAHTFRHSYATALLRETGNLSLVQRVLGHEDISTTQIYIHLCDRDVEEHMTRPLFDLE
ncbi:MAG: tyrosine-type recombinase/integrase [Sphaerochaeta sp.]|nr:tyrosine-type recombinase/integrase [Sphaerochaeta sp.]